MVFQFGSMRETLCAPQLSLGTGNLSTSGTLYFWLQGRNDVGYNLPSSPSETITYTAGQSIQITLPGDCYRSGENILQYSVSVNTVNDASTATTLLNFDRANITLPYVITLSEDSHLLTGQTVSAFPVGANRIRGLLRSLAATGLIYRYNPSSTFPADGLYTFAAGVGNWEYTYDGFSSFVENTAEDSNGCNLNILDIIDPARVLPKVYSLDGSAGDARVFWLKNDTSETISQGVRVGFTVSINSVPASEEFESLIKIVFDGYVNSLTGTLDTFEADGLTVMENLGVVKDYQFGRTDLVLPKPLEPGMAFQVRVYPQFNSYELQAVPLSGSDISVLGFFFDEAGSYNDASAFIGDAILPENPEFRRVYPSSGLSVLAEEGSGVVAGFFFKDIGRNTVPGLISNTAGQTIVINNNGSVYLKTISLDSNEALRAIVSSVAGESITSAFSVGGVTADSSPEITLTVTYPNQIDPNYNDIIAGASRGTFNAEEVVLYIRKNNAEIRRFTGLAPTNAASDTFTVSWANGTIVSNVKDNPFGLFKPNAPNSLAASTTGADTYTAAVGFAYLGNSITGISHKVEEGVIPEFLISLTGLSSRIVGLENSLGYWKPPVESYNALESKPSGLLVNGQCNRVQKEPNLFEIWTWDSTSTVIADGDKYIQPADLPDSASPGRWVRVSGGDAPVGGGDGGSTDQIVTYKGQVVVGQDGYVATSPLGGPITPGSALDDYLESNIVGGSKLLLSTNYSLTEQSNKYLVVNTNGSAKTVYLYDGQELFFREHLILNADTTQNVVVQYPLGNNLATLTPGQRLSILWDTTAWRIL